MSKKKVELEPFDGSEPKEVENEKLTEVIPLEDGVFSVVKFEDKYFLAMGKYRLSDLCDSLEEAKAEVNDTSWIRLMSVMHAVATEVYYHEDSLRKAEELKKNAKQD